MIINYFHQKASVIHQTSMTSSIQNKKHTSNLKMETVCRIHFLVLDKPKMITDYFHLKIPLPSQTSITSSVTCWSSAKWCKGIIKLWSKEERTLICKDTWLTTWSWPPRKSEWLEIPELVIYKIHPGSYHVHQSLWVDQNLHSFVFDLLIKLPLLIWTVNIREFQRSDTKGKLWSWLCRPRLSELMFNLELIQLIHVTRVNQLVMPT